jgi:hypothetical protein
MRARAWLVAAAVGVGCAHSGVPSAVPIVGPDGTAMLHVSCGADTASCYRLAGERCPFGYAMFQSAGGPGNVLVRCRDVRAASGTWPPSGELTASPYGPPANVAWPPPTELTPSPYGSAAPANTAGYPPLAPGGTGDDVGY